MTKPAKIILIAILLLAVAVVGGLHIASRVVVNRIQDMMGDKGHAARIDVGWRRIVLDDVEIGAPPDWPSRQTLRAARVTIEPDWRALLSDRLDIRRIVVSDYSLSVLRSADGSLQMLPTLRQRARERAQARGEDPDAPGKTRRETRVGLLVLEKGRLDFYDARVAKPPYRVPFENVNAEIGPLRAPANDEHTQIKLQGQMVGKQRRGAVSVQGWVALPSHDADVRTTTSGADVGLLAPYLQKHAPSLLTAGQMDLDMTTRVKNQQLAAQGKATLRDLDFSGGTLGSLPRRAVMAALEDRKGEVTFEFTLQGSLKDPKFSLTDDLSTRIVGGFTKAIGVSVEGVAEGVGSAVKGLGGALGELLGK
ncbi:DUF748 domain-containing protein [Bordetella bronchialis]|uniref:DUF748 domain-containing protein n=1 Tax=Bordetella bronchialis TaxID=463025 RepID=A0A193FUY6_9BORD|nr:DUF748 domain-containing protein [Bordetella bronchialis]ANN71148.1 hypothetical protein BAU08_07200 [Bordetella bronchialis]